MNDIAKRLKAYIESHDTDPPEISNGFKELEEFLCELPLEDNNAVFNLCCRLCIAYEHKAFLDGLQYGAHLISELHREKSCIRKYTDISVCIPTPDTPNE